LKKTWKEKKKKERSTKRIENEGTSVSGTSKFNPPAGGTPKGGARSKKKEGVIQKKFAKREKHPSQNQQKGKSFIRRR